MLSLKAVDEQQVGFSGRYGINRELRAAGVAYNADFAALAEEAHQRLAQEAIFGHDEYSGRRRQLFTVALHTARPPSALVRAPFREGLAIMLILYLTGAS